MTPWWNPSVHADRRPILLARNRIQSAMRGWLAAEGFTEVDTAALQVSPGNEAHLHGFATERADPFARSAELRPGTASQLVEASQHAFCIKAALGQRVGHLPENSLVL